MGKRGSGLWEGAKGGEERGEGLEGPSKGVRDFLGLVWSHTGALGHIKAW